MFIQVMPHEITEKDGVVVQNKVFTKAPPQKRYHFQNPHAIHERLVPVEDDEVEFENVIMLAPFVLKESDL